MAGNNRPRGREKHVTGQGKDIYKRGDGLGTGLVGGGSMSDRPGTRPGKGGSSRPSAQGGSHINVGGEQYGAQSSGNVKRGSSKISTIVIIIIAAVLIFGGGGGALGGLFGGGDTGTTSGGQQQSQSGIGSIISDVIGGGSSSGGILNSLGGLSNILGGATSFSGSNTSTGWKTENTNSTLDTTVVKGTRNKYTNILGSGKDTVTIMVYMCGTDLESKSGMASADLSEMAAADLGDNVNVIVYTGGCKSWKIQGISSSVNQIYKVEKGGISCLVKDDGNKKMTDPSTLASFIKWCDKNYEANRKFLIFWDHGGGSVSGYGYDEKNPSSGSMSLSGINTALKNAKVKFDVIGFDACLMATTENALMLTDYADYLIASEETEPGIGWYYTNWLNLISKNTSASTLEVGKKIVDDFVDVCAQKCRGQTATLSVVDLAELEKTVPKELTSFASSTLDLLKSDEYTTVSNARSGAREFAASSRIDQVDLVDLAQNIGTSESKGLAKAILGAVKYNRTSSDMTNAYGLSIYFPMKKTSTVDSAVKTYEAIGIDGEYADCIKQFATMEVGGQVASGGTANPFGSILSGLGTPSTSSSQGSSDMITSLLSSFLGGSGSSSGSSGGSIISGLTGSNMGFLSSLLDGRAATFIADNHFDASYLDWKKSGSDYHLTMPEEQWKLVHDLELNVFYDVGDGYFDLGLDNIFEFTDDGELVGEYDGTWLAVNGQPVAYYHVSTVDDGENYTITGRIPALLNGEYVDLIVVFDNDEPYGYIAGARRNYKDGETDTIAKETTGLEDGDVIDFVGDFYSYDGEYEDSYMIGDQLIVHGELEISNVYINADRAIPKYRFTDIYEQHYWTPDIPVK